MSATLTPVTAADNVTASKLDELKAWLKLKIDLLPTGAAVAIFVAMVIYGEIAYGRILQMNTISNLLINNSHLVILAVGLTFVIITGGIDLSVGAVIAFTSVTGVMLINAGWNEWLVVVLMIAMGGTFGLVSGILIQYFNVQPFIATLAMMFLARGLASMLSTVPERLAEDAQILSLATKFKLVDGPKVNDLVITPGVIIAVVVVAFKFKGGM